VLKPRSTNDHNSRESYLRAATNELRPYFAKHGLILPEKIRFAIAFTSHGKKGKVAGECWHAGASDDSHHEIIIRADFADPAEVLGILAHEFVHAALPALPRGGSRNAGRRTARNMARCACRRWRRKAVRLTAKQSRSP
jgi:hypothetical protein